MHLSVTDCDWNVSSVSVSSLSFLMCAPQKAVGHNLYTPAESISRTSRDESCVFVHWQYVQCRCSVCQAGTANPEVSLYVADLNALGNPGVSARQSADNPAVSIKPTTAVTEQ